MSVKKDKLDSIRGLSFKYRVRIGHGKELDTALTWILTFRVMIGNPYYDLSQCNQEKLKSGTTSI